MARLDYDERESMLFRQLVQYKLYIQQRQGVGITLRTTTTAVLDSYCHTLEHSFFVSKNSLRVISSEGEMGETWEISQFSDFEMVK